MSEGRERAQSRLSNLQAIEPLLSSLRVLSLSTMQMAMNRQRSLDEYAARFNEVADQVKQMTGWKPTDKVGRTRKISDGEAERYDQVEPHQILAVIGSTRGIVGQYNKNLVRLTKEYLAKNQDLPTQIVAFGRRIHSVLRQEGLSFSVRENLSTGSLPDYDVAADLIREWDQGIEEGGLKKVSILSYQRIGEGNQYKPMTIELLPGKLNPLPEEVQEEEGEEQEYWPPPIVEGEPELIFDQIESHIIAIHFYRVILDTVAAENLFRFRLLEEAKENTSNLLEELSLEVQANRRKEITQQMQELLVGSGMLAQR